VVLVLEEGPNCVILVIEIAQINLYRQLDSWSYVRQPDVTGYPVSLSKVYFCINLVQPKKGLNVKYWGSCGHSPLKIELTTV